MSYCIYNAIKTPDGTVLWCQDNHDYKTYVDTVSGETYMNDGSGYSVRRSVNYVPYEDLSIDTSMPFEKVRTAPFWGSYGKDGKSPRTMLSLEKMEDSHIKAILETQRQLRGTDIEQLFLKEVEYRRVVEFKEKLDENLEEKKNQSSKIKI